MSRWLHITNVQYTYYNPEYKTFSLFISRDLMGSIWSNGQLA